MELTQEQKERLSAYFADFVKNPTVEDHGQIVDHKQWDQTRQAAISELSSFVGRFLGGETTALQFKEQSELLCRKYPYWGFSAMSGQMQLNQYVNNISGEEKVLLLRDSLRVPSSIDEASSKINSVYSFLLDEKAKAENKKSIPRVRQPFLLSYFWEIQKPEAFPVYYGSSRKVLIDLGFDLENYESPGEEYAAYVKIITAIREFFDHEKALESTHSLWTVEHVLWLAFSRMSVVTPEKEIAISTRAAEINGTVAIQETNSWIPPIIADLGELSLNKETNWSIEKKVRPEKAFETKLKYAFTILGYDVTELGQGTGREPDGVALSRDVLGGDYAIIYDAKARESKYSLNTDDRSITEYIQKKQRELRRQHIAKFYFVIISSAFNEDNARDKILKIYRNTQVPVVMLRVSELFSIIEAKLQNIDVDHETMEHLFLETGLLTPEKISGILGA